MKRGKEKNSFNSVQEDENVLEMDGGDGCTTLSVLLANDICTPKNGENYKLYVTYILAQLKKQIKNFQHPI